MPKLPARARIIHDYNLSVYWDVIKSYEKTQSTGNITFALDAYPKHNVRYDVTFFISLMWRKYEI